MRGGVCAILPQGCPRRIRAGAHLNLPVLQEARLEQTLVRYNLIVKKQACDARLLLMDGNIVAFTEDREEVEVVGVALAPAQHLDDVIDLLIANGVNDLAAVPYELNVHLLNMQW